ncbi:glycosyltransferase [Pedobacter sp. LMG 31464]|uniref:Glycosyltransferase n=1 Tax=Pedobacter planticolens TaxID=2679964 RepID=A0A923DUH2_9SPHI|nr:glycosyltransferase family 4 protein [Pedobacter planticolens]MBB2144094.1 glycosyltransferase [Pedobacter planticolens]
MRIAITADPFIPVPPLNYGGIERIIYLLVEGLIENGHEVILVAHPDSNVSSELIIYSKSKSSLLLPLKNVHAINKLKKWKPDLIHSFSRLAYLIPFTLSKVPKIMSYQREPTLSQIKKAVKISSKNSLFFTGCSNYISNQIKPFASATTVYNCVNTRYYQFKENCKHDAPLVFLGRIEPIKGTHTAIKAAIATQKKLIIAGNIPSEYQGYFDTEIKPHLSQSIQYVGEVNDQQKNEILGNSCALLMPIDWNEPFGIVTIEAMACGTPVIGHVKGALPEIINHGVNGFLANNFDELCNYIHQIDQISRAAVRSSVEEKFSSEKIINDYISLYRQIISSNTNKNLL